jgi:AcrR family transcriptional regulator
MEPQQRREHLLDTGASLFAEKPYDDVQMEDIAARAGVSRSLLYQHFSSKRDLYVAIFTRASPDFSRGFVGGGVLICESACPAVQDRLV